MQTMSILKKYGKHLKSKIVLIIMICMFNVIHYWLLMFLKTLQISVLKYMNLILLIFLSAQGLAWQECLKKTKVELDLLTDIDMLLMFEKGIRDGIC